MPESLPSDHARHDTTLIARHAAGDPSDTDRATADALMATCAPCAALRRDLVAIAAATRSLPAPMTANRDFRLDPRQAERLQRGSWLRTILRPFGASRSSVRPMAAAFTTLGVAGLFVAMLVPGALVSPATSGAGQRDLTQEVASNNPPAASAAPGGQVNGFQPVSRPSIDVGYLGSGGGSESQGAGSKDNEGATDAPLVAAGGDSQTEGPTVGDSSALRAAQDPTFGLLMVGSLGLLTAGLLLLGLRFAARRLH